jgi:hypothetical protein
MTTKTNTTQSTSWITIAILIGIGIWLFKSCADSGEKRDIALKGIGMLQARGIDPDFLPEGAGSTFYRMMDPILSAGNELTDEEKSEYIDSLRWYNSACNELINNGLNLSEVKRIPESEIWGVVRENDQKTALRNLAERYK